MTMDCILKKLVTPALSLILFFSCINVYADYASILCSSGSVKCIRVTNNAGWVDLFPDPQQRDAAMRLNRMNTRLYNGMVIAVPQPGAGALAYAPFQNTIPATGRKTVIVDPSNLAWGAFDKNGQLLRWGPVSMGKAYCADTGKACHTPAGAFTIYRKQGGNCVSKQFPVGEGGSPMPWCMFFHEGYAMHGSYQVPGFNASHGCIRMFTQDAWWLNNNFASQGTKVIVRAT